MPAWFWGAAIGVIGVAVVVLLVKNNRPEPSAALRYDVARFEKVDAESVLYREGARIEVGADASALALGADDSVCVGGKKSLIVYARDGSEQRRIVLEGTPTALAVLPDGGFVVALEDRLVLLGADGAVRSTTDSLGVDAYITSVAAGADAIYAADAGNRVVLKLDGAGKVLARVGEEDASRDIPGFIVPSPYFDVAFDPDGALWAVNPGRLGLEQYRPDGSLVTSWYKPSMELDGFSGCCNPIHVAFRQDGSLVTAEKGLARVKLYSADWRFLGVVAGPDAFEESSAKATEKQLDAPILGVAVDSRGRVLVLDGGLNAVRVFEDKGGPTAS
ncbi:MAG: hypothetical protein RBU21_22125 [FCB group bacterium]|nr:hypothetical protein [FCB group bacterium]